MEVKVSKLTLDQYVALERFCASDNNCLKVAGLGDLNSDFVKVAVNGIGKLSPGRRDSAFRSGPVIQTYRDVIVEIADDILTIDEVHNIIDLLYHPNEEYLSRRRKK